MVQQTPLRLIYVTAFMPFGRGEQFLISETLQLVRQGFDVMIVPRSPRKRVFNQDAADLRSRCLRRRLLGLRVLTSAAVRLLQHPIETVRVLAIISKSNSLSAGARNALVLPKALWLATVAMKWQADHIHAHWGRTTATMTMIASELTGIPWSLTLHRNDIAEPNLLSIKTERAAFTRFISRSGVEMARAVSPTGDLPRTHVIHMGVDIPADTAQPQPLTLDGSDPVVLCPAHLYPVKGHKYLIAAMSLLRKRGVSCSLWIAGEGHLLRDLKRQVDNLGIEASTRFLGPVPHDQVLDWYRAGRVDIVVLPSVDLGNHEHEGIPVALMEAMAHGIPVVSTLTGGIPELLENGAGLLVRPNDPEALATALQQLLADLQLRSHIGHAGRERVIREFNVERTTAELAELIRRTSAPRSWC